jgi:hypothetical protein
VTFSYPTNKGDVDDLSGKAGVDQLFLFSQDLGADYSAAWVDSLHVLVTVRDNVTAAPPQIGFLVITPALNSNITAIDETVVGPGAYSVRESPPLVGSFAISPRLAVVLGANVDPEPDYAYGAGDTITFTFDEVTNLGGFAVGQPLAKPVVDSLFNSSDPIGVDYEGRWTSPTTFLVTVIDSGPHFISTFGDSVTTFTAIGPITNPEGTSSRVQPVAVSISGVFALAPYVTGVVASNPPGDTTYGVGDTVTLTFNVATNAAGANAAGILPAKNDVLAVMAPSQELGRGYTGQWVAGNVLEISISDPTDPDSFGAIKANAVVDIRTLTFALQRDGVLRNGQENSGVADGDTPAATGYFGVAPVIVSATATNTLADDEYSAEDTIVIVFDEDTDYGNRAITTPAVLNASRVDALFASSQNIGDDYNGLWVDRRTFRITILSVDGAEPPQIQVCVFRVVGAIANHNKYTPTATGNLSPSLDGTFARPPEVLAVAALNPPGDWAYAAGDVFVVTFNIDTNCGDGGVCGPLVNKTMVDGLLSPSFHIGSQYRAEWTEPDLRRTLRVTIEDATGAYDQGHYFTTSDQGTLFGRLNFTVAPSAQLRNEAETSGFSKGLRVPVVGQFSVAPVVLTATAVNKANDNFYQNQDEIHLRFNVPTNLGLQGVQYLTVEDVDAAISCYDGSRLDGTTNNNNLVSLGSLYTAAWTLPDTLVITIVDSTGATPPTVDDSVFFVAAVAGISNAYHASPLANSFSPVLGGTFASVPVFLSAIAVNVPGNGAYGNGDVIMLRFSTQTNYGGNVQCDLSEGVGGLRLSDKAAVDAIVVPSQNLGADYTAIWISAEELWITVVDATGALPPVIGELTFQVAPGANLKNAAETSGSSADLSMGVTGFFADPPSIIKAWATPGGGRSGGNPTITLFFDFPTEPGVSGRVLSQSLVDYSFEFNLFLGALYEASWVDAYSLVIEIIDPNRASLCTSNLGNAGKCTTPLLGNLLLTLRLQGAVRSAGGSDPSTSSILLNEGTLYNPPGFKGLVALNNFPLLPDTKYGSTATAGRDIFLLEFDTATDRGGTALGTVLTKAEVDLMILPSQLIGLAYTGQWSDAFNFAITVEDPGTASPQVGGMFFTLLESGNVRVLDGSSNPSKASTPVLSGELARPPSFLSVSAGSSVLSPYAYGVGDTLTVIFDGETNRGGLSSVTVGKAAIDSVIAPSQPLGDAYTAVWDKYTIQLNQEVVDSVIITITDPGVSLPDIKELFFTVVGDLRDVLEVSSPSTARSSFANGNFAEAPSILYVVAGNPSGDDIIGAGDTITVTFDQATDRGGLPAVLSSRAQVNELVVAQGNLGTDYSARWIEDDTKLLITLLDTARSSFDTEVRLEFVTGVRNREATSASMLGVTPALTGEFAMPPHIIDAVIDMQHPGNLTAGDTLTFLWSIPTITANSTEVFGKAAIDVLFTPSASIGRDYTARWLDRRSLQLTIEDAEGAVRGQHIQHLFFSTSNWVFNEQLTSVSAGTISTPLRGVELVAAVKEVPAPTTAPIAIVDDCESWWNSLYTWIGFFVGIFLGILLCIFIACCWNRYHEKKLRRKLNEVRTSMRNVYSGDRSIEMGYSHKMSSPQKSSQNRRRPSTAVRGNKGSGRVVVPPVAHARV